MLASEEYLDPNKLIALNLNSEPDFIKDFFDSRWEQKTEATLKKCNYKNPSQFATINRAGRLSFRKFFGYSNNIKYDALYCGKFSNIYRN